MDAHVFDKGFQGTQTFLRELYNQLLLDYPALDIYFGAHQVENIRAIFPHLPAKNILPYKKRKHSLLRYVYDIPFYIRKGQFDFAHFQYVTPTLIPGCKYIVTLHDVLYNDFKEDFSFLFRTSRNLLFGKSIKSAHIKTTVSNYSRQAICRHYAIPEKDVHIIQNAANSLLNTAHLNKQEAADFIYRKFGIQNFILYISRIEPRKNQLLLLEKYLELALYEKGIALVLIGEASAQVGQLNQLIQNLKPAQRRFFYWLKEVDQSDLSSFYKACRLFVYPSKAEGFGIPPLEAAVCHAPVLCSSVTAMQDFSFFEPYTFDPGDEYDFKQKLAMMIDHPPTEAFIKDVAYQALNRYNWSTSSKLFYNLLIKNTLEMESSFYEKTSRPIEKSLSR